MLSRFCKHLTITRTSFFFPKISQLLEEVCSSVDSWSLPEQADSLAKEGSAWNPIEVDVSLEEARTQLKTAIHQRWLEKHSSFSKDDAFHNLSREEQTPEFRLRTGHNRLNKHMNTKFRIGTIPNYPCGNIAQTMPNTQN